MQDSELKLRKSLNISIQSKRYYLPINDIIKEWEEQGLSLSTKVCETLLLGYKLSNSVELSKLVNTFEMISKTLSHYYNERNTDEYLKAIENVFNQVITVDGAKLSEFLANPIKFSNGGTKTTSVPKQQAPEVKKEVALEPQVAHNPISNATYSNNSEEIAVTEEKVQNKYTENVPEVIGSTKEIENSEEPSIDINEDLLFNM